MSFRRYKYLVIGQGLAGTLVSHQLIKRGANVYVIDGQQKSASSVAAGMWNPLSFRRVISTWKAQTMVKHLHETYPEIERILGEKIMHQRTVRRFFPNENYRDLWIKNTQNEEISRFIGNTTDTYGEVTEAGYVDLNKMIEGWRSHLLASDVFSFGKMNEVIKDKDGFCFRDVKAERLIVCTGVGMTEHLDEQDWLRTNKGELLNIDIDVQDSHVLNNGKWLLPLAEGGHKLGASYDWRSKDYEPTIDVKEHLLIKLQSMVDKEYEVREHLVGLRPISKDRRPLVGLISTTERAFVFNGLGTRGVLIGPYCAWVLANYLEDGKDIPKDIDAARTNISLNLF